MPPTPAADDAATPSSSGRVESDNGGLPLLPGERLVSRVLARVVVTAALTAVLMALACAVLAALGLWTPWLALPLALALAVGAHRTARPVVARPLPIWVASTLVAVAAASAVWTGLTHAEQVLPRRDAGSYAQSATALALGHRTPIAVDPAELGGPAALRIDGVTLTSPAFYEIGSAEDPAVQPQFMIGAPAWYSMARWFGVTAMLMAPALFGGLTVLAVGLLAGRAVGARWAPLAATTLALAFPYVHTVRATYSEPVALLALAAGLLTLTEGTRAGQRGRSHQARRLGLLAGLLVAGGGLIRADALRETILLLPVAALLLVRRNPVAWPLLAGAVGMTVVSGVVGVALSYRYLGDIAASLVPLLALGVLVAGLCAFLVWACRRGWRLPALVARSLPAAAAAAVGLAFVVLATRPLWQTVRQSAADPGAGVVAGLQLRQGLPVDGGRTYAEQTLAWTAWWVGWPALLLTVMVLATCAFLIARAWTTDTPLPSWTGAAIVAFGSSVLVWWRPGITPDHPWADRRLLIVLGMVAVCATAGAAWTVRYAARRLPAAVLALTLVGMCAAVLVPPALATWPHLTERVERGEVTAVDQVCAALQPGDVVVTADDRAANEWPQVVRGWCGVPTVSLTNAVRRDEARREAAIAALAALVATAGNRLVVLSADSPAAAAGPSNSRTATQVLDVTVLEDARLLERRPDDLVPLPLTVWLAPVA